MESKKDSLEKILRQFSGTDMAKLAIPKQSDLDKMTGQNHLFQVLQSAQDMHRVLTSQIAITGLANNLSKIADEIQRCYKPQLDAFQKLQISLQPFLIQQSKLQEALININKSYSPIFDTLTRYNAFVKYQTIYQEFGGSFNINDYRDEEISQTIEENKDLIGEIKEVIIKAENAKYTNVEIPELIFSYLQKAIPNINPRKYAIIVAIVFVILYLYQFHLHYSTEETIQEVVVPALRVQDIKQKKILDNTVEIRKENEEIEENVEKVSNKLDSLIMEMKKFSK